MILNRATAEALRHLQGAILPIAQARAACELTDGHRDPVFKSELAGLVQTLADLIQKQWQRWHEGLDPRDAAPDAETGHPVPSPVEMYDVVVLMSITARVHSRVLEVANTIINMTPDFPSAATLNGVTFSHDCATTSVEYSHNETHGSIAFPTHFIELPGPMLRAVLEGKAVNYIHPR